MLNLLCVVSQNGLAFFENFDARNSFMTEVPFIKTQSTDLLCKAMGWSLYDKGLCHEKVNARAK